MPKELFLYRYRDPPTGKWARPLQVERHAH
jgi:hypothetical protein